MQRQDKLIVYFFKKAFENIPNDGKEKGKQIQFASFLAILAILCLFLTGSEAVKVTLRKKTGKGELSFIRLFLTFLFLLILGILFINKNTSSTWDTQWSAETGNHTFLIAGWFYICFAVFIAVMGILNKVKKRRPVLPEMYPGRCRLFEKAENKSGLRRSAIRNMLHPIIFLIGGSILFSIHPLLGLPLIACAISYWFVFIVEYTLGFEEERLQAIEQYDGTLLDISKKLSYNGQNQQGRSKKVSSIADKWK